MDILEAASKGKKIWNKFIGDHYPVIGAFMQTWEWGEFQQALGRKVERYFINDGGKNIAAFTLVSHSMPFGFSYGYIPRGPVFETGLGEEKILDTLAELKKWAEKNLYRMVFVRLEPPIESITQKISEQGFKFLPYYVQPRFNTAVSLNGGAEEIINRFHPSTRSNIRRAEKRGVAVVAKNSVTEEEFNHFFSMAAETIKRNSGVNAYPSSSYFYSLVDALPSFLENNEPNDLSLGIFFGYQNNQPAAAHFVLFFGETATYLYGASYTKHLPSKITTYLHWTAMREAQKRGLRYYDIGGVDKKRWPSLTAFKEQFRGKEFSYVGNIDIPIRPFFHGIYNLFRRIRKSG